MRNGLFVVAVFLGGCWAPMPDHEVLPPLDGGPPSDAGGWVCGPGACAGCCDRGRCRAGNSESACGNGGMACAECGGDALCGASSTCEPLDPGRYSQPADPNAEPRNAGSTCRTINNQWICW